MANCMQFATRTSLLLYMHVVVLANSQKDIFDVAKSIKEYHEGKKKKKENKI
jgi:hypothetical protein